MRDPIRPRGLRAFLTPMILAASLGAASACAPPPGSAPGRPGGESEASAAPGAEAGAETGRTTGSATGTDSGADTGPTRALARLQGLDGVVREAFRGSGVLGAVVAVVVGDSVVLLEGLTAPTLAAVAPVDPDGLFPAAAAMPVVNALAAAAAAHAGTMALDRPVGEYLPDLPDTLHGATLVQLLTHRAGLVRHPALAGRRGDGLDAAARQLTYIDRLAPPGAIHSLAPAGISLAAWLLQQEDGRPYARLVDETVLAPLGMQRATVVYPGAESLAQGYRESRTAGARYAAVEPEPDSALGVPIHGLYATASDLATLARALLNNGLIGGEQRIPPELVREALRPRGQIPGVAGAELSLAGRLDRWEDRRRLTLLESTPAHAMTLRLLPDDSLGVVVLSNLPSYAIVRIADAAFRHLLGLPDPPRRASSAAAAGAVATVEPPPAAEVAGVYQNGGEALELIADGGGLRLRSGGMELEVRPSNGRYRAVLPDGRPALTFEIVHDSDGRAYIWLGDRALARQPG